MVLAIGIVVDDAIVVLENVERIMHEEHLTAREAAIKAMQEVTGPIIAIVLVLCAVFVPIAFLGGLTGELYRQFAVTIAIAVVISGLVALTLTPALCVLILKRGARQPSRFFRGFNDWFGRVTERYARGVAWMLRRAALGVLLFVGMVAITVGLWRITPGSLVPDEDQGYYIAAVILPDGATLERTDKVVSEVVDIIQSNPANENVVAFTGFDFLGGAFRNSAATIFVTQKHWDERNVPVQALVGELWMKTGHIKEALVLAFNPPPIFGLGNAGGFEFYVQNRGEGGAKRLSEVTQQFLGRAGKDPAFAQVNTLWRPNVPQLYVDLDREKAKALGVPLDELFDTVAATLGSLLRQRLQPLRPHVAGADVGRPAVPQVAPTTSAASACAARRARWCRSRALVDVRYTSGPETLDRFNNLPAVKLFGARRAGRELRPRRSPQSRRSRARCCRPTSRSTGAARRSRRRRRAAPPCSLLALARGHGVPDPRRAVRELVAAARRCCSRCRSARSARSPRCGCAA